ncbi:MAG TPA: BatA domain-containing protein [Chitinophagales bacterium]|nr:BatA domain-containing protein [Chitinophagales bacterium]HNA38835.1 BatA domain-containing protein [Chitinophagales bacterium]
MSFIFPWFLLALLTLAIPVIIHLFYFRKYKKVYFSDIRFLKQVQEEKSTIDKIKKRWILAARLLALFFLVLAFVQPFIGKKNKQLSRSNSSIVVYVDNSYSMGLKSGGEAALSIAKEKARELANAFSSNDKFALLTNELTGTHQRWMQKQNFLDAVEKIELSPTVKHINEIAQKQAALFQTVGDINKLGFFISDFQKNMLSDVDDTTFTQHFLQINGNPEKNIYVDSCWFEQPVFTVNSTNKLMVRVKNAGNTTADKIRISVKINDAVKSIDDISIPAENYIIDSFSFSITQAAWQRGEISFNDYPITFDDKFYFAFNVLSQEKVLSIEEKDTPNNIASVFANDAHFIFDKTDAGQIDYSAFKNYALIILNQLHEISSGLAASLKEYLDNGGNIYIIPNPIVSVQAYNTFLSTNNAGTYGELQTKSGEVTKINLQEDVFKNVFSILPKNVETPKINKYYPILSTTKSVARELLSTNLGSPLVAKFDAGNGFIYLQATPLNNTFSNLQSMALFAPMVYNIAVFKKNKQALYYNIGKDNLIELKNENASNERVFTLSNGKYEFIPENRTIGNTVLLRVNTNLPSDAHYSVNADGKTVAMAAFNFDRTESDIKFADKSELQALYKNKNQIILDNTRTNLAAAVKHLKDGILLWKLCVILSLLFLLIEILLIRFWK